MTVGHGVSCLPRGWPKDGRRMASLPALLSSARLGSVTKPEGTGLDSKMKMLVGSWFLPRKTTIGRVVACLPEEAWARHQF
jgi:hypothetical protein